MTAQYLIAQSISQNEIVHAPFSESIAESLEAQSDNGGTRNGDVTEYWGETSKGEEWRVHLDHTAQERA